MEILHLQTLKNLIIVSNTESENILEYISNCNIIMPYMMRVHGHHPVMRLEVMVQNI